jgi:hypothetical protein
MRSAWKQIPGHELLEPAKQPREQPSGVRSNNNEIQRSLSGVGRTGFLSRMAGDSRARTVGGPDPGAPCPGDYRLPGLLQSFSRAGFNCRSQTVSRRGNPTRAARRVCPCRSPLVLNRVSAVSRSRSHTNEPAAGLLVTSFGHHSTWNTSLGGRPHPQDPLAWAPVEYRTGIPGLSCCREQSSSGSSPS